MAGTDDAYLLKYRGVQLGTELVRWNPQQQIQPANVVPLYGSPRAGITRQSNAGFWVLEAEVYVLAATPQAAELIVNGWASYADGATGDVTLYQNFTTPVLIRTYSGFYLDAIQRTTEAEPAGQRIIRATLTFVGNSDPA